MMLTLRRFAVGVTLGGVDGEGWLWWVDDGEFRYAFLLGVHTFSRETIAGISLVVGPLMFTVAFARR